MSFVYVGNHKEHVNTQIRGKFRNLNVKSCGMYSYHSALKVYTRKIDKYSSIFYRLPAIFRQFPCSGLSIKFMAFLKKRINLLQWVLKGFIVLFFV
jgi:hypothetical protein